MISLGPARLTAIGIPVLDLNRTGDLSLYVDGADEAVLEDRGAAGCAVHPAAVVRGRVARE